MEEELTDLQILRIAQKIQNHLLAMRVAKYSHAIRCLDNLAQELERIQSFRRKLGIAVGRSWFAAADKMASGIPHALRDIPYYIGEAEQACQQTVAKPPTLGDIVGEMRQLQDEFDQVKFDPKRHTLSATTDPIELEEIFLGEFEIRLDLFQLEDTRHGAIYRVIAVDPHPAASNDSVTHPHVSDEHLCEGDAGAAIGAALATGRICDLFMLVRSVLQHYNPSSPYVSLADWFGASCHECGYTTHEDDSHWCPSCQETFCGGCTSYCSRCEETHCVNCLEECSVCGDRVCSACRTTCEHCGRTLCVTCQEESQCPCIEERKDNQKDEHDNDKTAPVGVGAAAGDSDNTDSGQNSG